MGRFFSALAYYVSFRFLRNSERIRRAAERTFTESPEGIRAGFQIHRDQLAKDYRNIEEAVALIETVIADHEAALKALKEEEPRIRARMNGAVDAAAEALAKAKAAGAAQPEQDPEYLKAKAAFARYEQDLARNTQEQSRKSELLAQQKQSIQSHERRLTELGARLQALSAEEAEAVAAFVTSEQIIQLNHRLQHATNSLETSPVDAIREAVRRKEAQARVSERITGTDSRTQDAEFEARGKAAASGDTFAALVNARAADHASRDGASPAPETEETRPRIA